MDIGISIQCSANTRECAIGAENAGIDVLAHSDSQCLGPDLYPTLTTSTELTDEITLATLVTNPVTRHVSVTASAIATIDEISNGRLILGIGTGDSAVRNTELKPAKLETLEQSVEAIRELWAEGGTEWNGGPMNIWTEGKDIPIFIAASGPKTLEAAGRIADGVVYLGDRNKIEWARSQVKRGAESVSRSMDDITFWFEAPGEVADSEEKALNELRHSLAAVTHIRAQGPLNEVPDDVAERMRMLADEYKSTLHHQYAESHNAELVEKYDLFDEAKKTTIAGTPEQVVDQIRECEQKGVDGVIFAARHDHPVSMIHRLGDEVLPELD